MSCVYFRASAQYALASKATPAIKQSHHHPSSHLPSNRRPKNHDAEFVGKQNKQQEPRTTKPNKIPPPLIPGGLKARILIQHHTIAKQLVEKFKLSAEKNSILE